jgi:ribosomal protein L11 methyltransferase
MKWIEVTVTTSQPALEPVSDLLLSLGANGVEIVDPEAFRRVLSDNSHLDYADDGFLDQYGTHVIVRAYYQDGRDQDAMSDTVLRGLDTMSSWVDASPGTVEISIRDDAEWKDVWKDYFKPFVLAPGFVVKPSWEDYAAKAGETVIEMDPGMAFGTGMHETTRMCAGFAAKLVKPGDRVMDIGCGTAILGIVAAKCGALEVTAIDIDDAAVRTARENVVRNRVADIVRVSAGTLADVGKSAHDVLLINIIADVIIALAPDFPAYLEPGGLLVASGIIHSRLQDVMTACEQNGFVPVEHCGQGEWDAVVFRCIGS